MNDRQPTGCADNPTFLSSGRYRCPSPDAMRRLGECLGACLESGDVVVLSGDLGAGKTCLTGGVARALGDVGPVTSPTFQIMCVHDTGRIPLYHFDLYRLEDASQLDDVGIFDVLEGDGACLVEWGDLFAEELGGDYLDVRITREGVCPDGSEPARVVDVSVLGSARRGLLESLDAAVEAL